MVSTSSSEKRSTMLLTMEAGTVTMHDDIIIDSVPEKQ